jgi:histidinol-phosphate/aromatic aminotransferase/cobyric acid decarboxylase-like protein
MQDKATHGGDFFQAIGVDLGSLERADEVISADVLDAWYDPSPRVLEQIHAHLAFLVRTSPPTHAEGLKAAIAASRDISPENIVVGAGTSSLMFTVLPELVGPGDHVVLLDPSYGEYRHIFENVIPCRTSFLELQPREGFSVDVNALADLASEAKLIILVNPNSPTGVCSKRIDLQRLLSLLEPETRVWIDETYIDFVSGHESMEDLVAMDSRIIIAKSMSKFYALSGLRLGYLVLSTELAARIERATPPWNIGLVAQLAGVLAIDDPYYPRKVAETHQLRSALVTGLEGLGLHAFQSETNFVLCRLPNGSAHQLVQLCAKDKVFIRDCGSISHRFEDSYVRIAVKPQNQLELILRTIGTHLREAGITPTP